MHATEGILASDSSGERALVRSPTSAGGLQGYRHEHAAAARVKGRHRIELGSHFARIEGVARGTRWAHVLAHDSGSDPLTGEVRAHVGTALEHIEPLGQQTEFAEPVRFRFRGVRRRDSVEAIPPSWKDPGGSEHGLPAIEVGPREIRSASLCRHRSGFVQSRAARTFMTYSGPPRRATMRPAAPK